MIKLIKGLTTVALLAIIVGFAAGVVSLFKLCLAMGLVAAGPLVIVLGVLVAITIGLVILLICMWSNGAWKKLVG